MGKEKRNSCWKKFDPMACGLHMLELEFSFCDEKIVSKQSVDWIKVKIELRYEIWVLNFEL